MKTASEIRDMIQTFDMHGPPELATSRLLDILQAINDRLATVEATVKANSPPSEILCPACHGAGQWECECCNGSGGCSCGGQPVPMGQCHVCHGTGKVPENITPEQAQANCRAIAGMCFLGSGPSSGYWADKGKRGFFK